MSFRLTSRHLTIATLVLFVASLVWWCVVDTRPPAWDETVHLDLAVKYQQWILHHQPFDTRWSAIYPPLYHLSLIPALMVWGHDVDRVLLTHVAYALLLIWALRRLSWRFTGESWLGAIAAVLVLGMPMMMVTAHRPLIDFALVAWVALGMELLLQTEHFNKRSSVVLFALWSGFGMLLKPLYVMWFVGPVLWSLWQSKRQHGKWQFKSLLMGAAVVFVVALPYYGWQGIMFFKNAATLASSQGALEGDPGFDTLAGWAWYVNGLASQVGKPLVLILSVGCLIACVRQWKNTHVQLLMVWLLSGYVLFTFDHNKDLRYTLPIVVPFCLLGLWPIYTWWRERDPRWVQVSWMVGAAVFVWNAYVADPPRKENWQHEALLSVMTKAQTHRGDTLRAAIVSNHPHFFSRSIQWTAATRGLNLWATFGLNKNADFNEFVVLKSGEVFSPTQAAERDQLLSSAWFANSYQRIATLALPDDSQAEVYQRHLPALPTLPQDTVTYLQTQLQSALSKFVTGDMQVTVEGTADELQHGHIHRLTVAGGPWSINGIPLTAAELVINDAEFNTALWREQQGLGLANFASVQPCLKFSAAALTDWLRAKQPKLQSAAIEMRAGQLLAEAYKSNTRLAVTVAPTLDDSRGVLQATLVSLSIGKVTLPGWMLGRVHQQQVLLNSRLELPGEIALHQLRVDDQQLVIGCDK